MYRHHKHNVCVNGLWIHDILIDNHVTQRHGDSIDDLLVLQLVSLLHMQYFRPEALDENGFEYFVNSDLILNGKAYRLVWLLPLNKNYLGVRTAFRRRSHGK